MSDTGLYTHLYMQLRDCAELIDRVIVECATAGTVAATEERRALATVLRALDNAPASSLSATLLANVLREKRTFLKTGWSDVADAIDRGNPSTTHLQRLEQLASALESERANMHARIHGSHAR